MVLLEFSSGHGGLSRDAESISSDGDGQAEAVKKGKNAERAFSKKARLL